MKVVLASKSPRRRELILRVFPDAVCVESDADENVCETDPGRLTELLAQRKATAVSKLEEWDTLVIGADTVVAKDDKIYTKPCDRDDARRMLRELSDGTHSVFTGVCMICKGKTVCFTEETKVTFFPLSDSEITQYLNTGEADDKAGAYGIQGLGGLFVSSVNGDYYNVVGLPIARLMRKYHEFF